jgi:hemoglobin
MLVESDNGMSAVPPPPRRYGPPITVRPALPDADAEGITDNLIHAVVMEFYRRARHDGRLGPVFESHVHDWDSHLARMTDFWSAVLLRTGQYSGQPVERHRLIGGLTAGHFDRWIELFEETVRDLCPPGQSEAFLVRARRMRDGLTMVLGLDGRLRRSSAFPSDSEGADWPEE